jgi:hypothetical protein
VLEWPFDSYRKPPLMHNNSFIFKRIMFTPS